MKKYIIKQEGNEFQIDKWNSYCEKYIPCTIKHSFVEAQEFINRVLAVRNV